MTDEEIVWALENCRGRLEIERCKICPFEDKGCRALMEYNAAELINRQKAEIERLVKRNFELSEKGEAVCIAYKTAKIEAIKEFVEKLKAAPIAYDIPLFGLSTKNEIIDYSNNIMGQVRDAIDSLVEEMAGAANEKT